MKFTTKTRLALLATVATAVLIQPAMALDAQKFVDRIVATYGAVGYDIKPGAVSADGANVVVKGVKIGLKADATAEPLSLDQDITFTNVAEGADGSYTAESVTMPDVEYDIVDAKAPGHISLKNIELDSLFVPGGDKPNFVASLQMIGSLGAGPLVVTRAGEEILSIDTISASNTFDPAQGSADLASVASTFDLNGFKADLTTVAAEDPSAGAVITELGLTKVSGDIDESMTWDMADGHLVIDNFTIALNDKGSISFLADLTGFTPAVMDKLAAASADTAGKTPEQVNQANGMLAMEVMSAVSITSASLRYDDASLANSLIDFFAKQQGTDHAGFVTGLKAMVPAMLAGVGIPALDALVVPAVNTFLDDPQSLEVAVAPASPTNLMVLMGAAANPAALIQTLGLTVTANVAAPEGDD